MVRRDAGGARPRGLPDRGRTTRGWRRCGQRPTPARVLAWAEAVDGYAVGSAAALSTGDGRRRRHWRHVGWHEIEHGGWNAETRKLSWAEYGGRRGSVELTGAGRLPELFRERIAASIVVERFVPIAGDRGVVVNGRRDLSATVPVIAWHATLGRGLTWRTPGLRETVDEAMAELRAEYDPGHGSLIRSASPPRAVPCSSIGRAFGC